MRNPAGVHLTTKHRADASCKLSRIEGLAEIIIGPNLKADDPIDVLLQCGKKNNRYKRVIGSHVPTDVQARSIRQHDIEHDQFDVVGIERGLEGALVGCKRYPKSL